MKGEFRVAMVHVIHNASFVIKVSGRHARSTRAETAENLGQRPGESQTLLHAKKEPRKWVKADCYWRVNTSTAE